MTRSGRWLVVRTLGGLCVLHGPAKKVSACSKDLNPSGGTFGNDVVELGQDRGQNGIVPPSKPALIEGCRTYIEDVLDSLFISA